MVDLFELYPWADRVLRGAARTLLPSTEGTVTRADLYQEGFLALGAIVAAHRPSTLRAEALERWAFRCVRRKMIQFLESARGRKKEVELPEEFVPVARAERSEAQLEEEGNETLAELGRGLSADDRELLRLRFLEGKGPRETGRILGVHGQSVVKRTSKMRPTLRANLRRLMGAA